MTSEEFFGSFLASVMLGLLIKLGVALSHHSIGIWWALLIGFVLVYGGILLLTSDVIE